MISQKTKFSFKLLTLLSTVFIADECPTMAVAIPRVFVATLHKLCRWHILKKYREPLGILYKMYETFKVEFTAILNWPLMPTEFEAAWHELVAKYDLHNNNMMIQLWEGRREWISAYFKEVFCARMTSTQRSETMNYILKKNDMSKKSRICTVF